MRWIKKLLYELIAMSRWTDLHSRKNIFCFIWSILFYWLVLSNKNHNWRNKETYIILFQITITYMDYLSKPAKMFQVWGSKALFILYCFRACRQTVGRIEWRITSRVSIYIAKSTSATFVGKSTPRPIVWAFICLGFINRHRQQKDLWMRLSFCNVSEDFSRNVGN